MADLLKVAHLYINESVVVKECLLKKVRLLMRAVKMGYTRISSWIGSQQYLRTE